ncbi:MAG TPA: type I methionyl aminopeptidase [Candidatus Saccharimonadales bacterium]|nr:type I methionyl aminopeptidase [Candidatus Saccharimonadales bacterium]
MTTLKTPEEIKVMLEGGKISTMALRGVLSAIKPGVTLLALDTIAHDILVQNNAKPSFTTVDDYKFTTCINVNDGIVHGLPNGYKIKSGDLVSIDLGALYKGFHTDLSYTVEVNSSKEQKFLNTGRLALDLAIAQAKVGNHMGDISSAIQKKVENAGYTVSRDLVGHGVGRELHEDPYVPGYGSSGKGVLLKEGMVLAIEVLYEKGDPEIVVDFDGWTIRTADGSLSALFEASVAITKDGPLVLTEF